jgi:hypothetical protein
MKSLLYVYTDIPSCNYSKVCVPKLDVDKLLFSTQARQYWAFSCTQCSKRILLYFGRTSPQNTATSLSQLPTHFLPLSPTFSSEANSRSASNEIPNFFMESEGSHFRIHFWSLPYVLEIRAHQIKLVLSFSHSFLSLFNVCTITLIPYKRMVWFCVDFGNVSRPDWSRTN